MTVAPFTFVDLFAGIGGFHLALSALGGECVYASEIDAAAVAVYEQNWGMRPDGDITLAANDTVMNVPPHDVLLGGFPCQPFSKSGYQRGMDETRGTLFWNIARIIEVRRPKVVLLENVRNIAGPRHLHEWEVIIKTLRELGYRVSADPLVVSPHMVRPDHGGRPQVRERVFIAATLVGDPQPLDEPILVPDLGEAVSGWDPHLWDLERDLPLDTDLSASEHAKYALTEAESRWLEAWNDFVEVMRERLEGERLPGFPIWADAWVKESNLRIPSDAPDWKRNFLIKNANFYTQHQEVLDAWLSRWNGLSDFPPSRRKFEWQAQDAANLFETVMHFRPSGIRAKRPTYLPALVAITQTSILGGKGRRISTREAARLQSLPEWFRFEGQSDAATYKQLGNGVNAGVVYNVIKAHVRRDLDLFEPKSRLAKAVLDAPANPDLTFEAMTPRGSQQLQLPNSA